MSGTIYGDYVALAVSDGGRWHIQGPQADKALCGRQLSAFTGDRHRMELHVSLLECPTCMQKGGEV